MQRQAELTSFTPGRTSSSEHLASRQRIDESPSTSRIPLKRKSSPQEQKNQPKMDRRTLHPPHGEYESGRVNCVCGKAVSFRDESTGGFTLKHWDAHRQQCPSANQVRPETAVCAPENFAETRSNPVPKRRRAKRTEEERIDYLRSDPYVAQFEAFRVLCASCDKWIRLRPNSTYCSIPWDAHRKSCLSRKINNKNVYALDERNALFSKDPDIRKFDSERILCNICDRWLALNSPDNHLQVVQEWLQHRASCQVSAVAASTSDGLRHQSSRVQPCVESCSPRTQIASSSPVVASGHVMVESSRSTAPSSARASSSPLCRGPAFRTTQDFAPIDFHPSQESRRRNAEHRAAALRADPLVAKVEPGRAFCSLCKKWVQLRQDSSYCAYPWLQHRGKCLMRFNKRREKSTHCTTANDGLAESDSEMELDSDHTTKDLENNEVHHAYDHSPEYTRSGTNAYLHGHHRGIHRGISRKEPEPEKPPSLHAARVAGECGDFGSPDSSRRTYMRGKSHTNPGRLADLDSSSGRRKFVFASIHYLFSTTYEVSDDMTISALLTFLNAAMPQDKHEDFDTRELVKAVAEFHEQGYVSFEGDTLRRTNQ